MTDNNLNVLAIWARPECRLGIYIQILMGGVIFGWAAWGPRGVQVVGAISAFLLLTIEVMLWVPRIERAIDAHTIK